MYVNFSDEIKPVFKLRCGLMRVIKGRTGVFLPAMFRQPILRPVYCLRPSVFPTPLSDQL